MMFPLLYSRGWISMDPMPITDTAEYNGKFFLDIFAFPESNKMVIQKISQRLSQNKEHTTQTNTDSALANTAWSLTQWFSHIFHTVNFYM